MPVDSDSFGGRSGILSKPQRVSGPGPREDRQGTRPPCAASAKEAALRPRPALARGSAVAGRESCVPGLAERALGGRFSNGTRRSARTGRRRAGLGKVPACPAALPRLPGPGPAPTVALEQLSRLITSRKTHRRA